MSEKTFADLGVSTQVVDALKERGIEAPFPIQRLVIEDVMAGHDVLAKSPTGSGKTLAFSIPTVERIGDTKDRPAALVLAPTRELATQIVEELRAIAEARGLRVAAVYGGIPIEKQAKAADRANILVATPGRLEDLLDRGEVYLDRVQVLVLDEADRMLDMGFKPAVDRIVSQCPRDRQTLFFSATLHGAAGRVAATYTTAPRRHEYRPTEVRATNVEHRFVTIRRHERINALIEELRKDGSRTLVFVRTKRGADRLVDRLTSKGVSAAAMHGDKNQRQREKALARFEKGSVETLVATDVAARGIDVDGITTVVNFDLPEDRESYLHRVGRTARAGRSGVSITFIGSDRAHDAERIASELCSESKVERLEPSNKLATASR